MTPQSRCKRAARVAALQQIIPDAFPLPLQHPQGGRVTVEAFFVPNVRTLSGSIKKQSVFALPFAGMGARKTAQEEDLKGRLRIVVTDSGAGISPENQKRLFKVVCVGCPAECRCNACVCVCVCARASLHFAHISFLLSLHCTGRSGRRRWCNSTRRSCKVRRLE